MNWLVGFAVLFFVVGCGHRRLRQDVLPPPLNLRPPELGRLSALDRASLDQLLMQLGLIHQEKNVQWFVNYRRAQLWTLDNPQLSCELFGALTKEKLFPLQNLAKLHALDTCDFSHIKLLGLNDLNWHKFDSPLRELARDIALRRALIDTNLPERLRLLLEKSRDNIALNERIAVVTEALQLAQQLKDAQSEGEARKRLYRLSPRLNPEPAENDWLDVALDFRRHREFNKAIDLYYRFLRLKNRTLAEKVLAFRGLRQTYKLARDRDKSIAVSQELAAFVSRKFAKMKSQPEFVKIYQDVLLDVARSLWTNGHSKDSQAVLAELEKNLRHNGNLSEDDLIVGRMFEERKDAKMALVHFNKALDEASTPAARCRLLWFVAWNQKKLGMIQEAMNNFEKLRTNSDDPFVRNRSAFWLVKCLQLQGDKLRADVELKQLIQDDPFGYYGLLAHRELKIPIPSLRAKNIEVIGEIDPEKSLLKDVFDINQTNWLLSVEEKSLAKKYLDAASDKLRSQGPLATVDMWQELLGQYIRAEDFAALNEQLIRLPTRDRVDILNRHPEFLFPTPYPEIVAQSAQQFGVTAELIYSIMRQESSFNPFARSMADAFGLMQILPELASKTQSLARVSLTDTEDLFNPQINIPIGAAYLSQLWSRYHGQFVLIVANYNAAEDAIQTWLNTRWRGDTLEFIEDIPYEETRGYIRLVMRNLIFYSLLKAPPSGLPFPEWVLELKPLST